MASNTYKLRSSYNGTSLNIQTNKTNWREGIRYARRKPNINSYGNSRYRGSLSASSTKMETCARVFVRHICLNGMFTLTKMIGYTQFMVYIIVRLIVCGSLAGRLFVVDQNLISCNYTYYYQDANLTNELPTDLEGIVNYDNLNSTEVQNNCLRVAYHDSISPLFAWVITLFTPALPWICLLPWTPLSDSNDESCKCPYVKIKWSCLTPYIAIFLRTNIRLLLETICFIWIVVEYEMYIPAQVSCYAKTLTCSVTYSEEMTCFLWILTALNLVCIMLTVWELLYMCSHKEEYGTDQDLNDAYSSREFRSPTFSKKFDEIKPLEISESSKQLNDGENV